MSIDYDKLLKSYEFRSINVTYPKTWDGFIALLFSNNDKCDEFGIIKFKFDLDHIPIDSFTQTDEEDESSVESFYRILPIQCTTFRFPKTNVLEDKLRIIKNRLPSFFSKMGKDKLSDPTLIISGIGGDCIKGYYIWQSK